MLLGTYYAQNYASIIGGSLPTDLQHLCCKALIKNYSDINFNTSDLLNGQVIKQFWVKLKPTKAIL